MDKGHLIGDGQNPSCRRVVSVVGVASSQNGTSHKGELWGSGGGMLVCYSIGGQRNCLNK